MTITSILSDLWRGAFEASPPSPQAQELQKKPRRNSVNKFANSSFIIIRPITKSFDGGHFVPPPAVTSQKSPG